jgi:hypothetical protein
MIRMKNKKNPVIMNESEIDSTLKDLDNLALAIPQGQEIEGKVELMEEVQSLAVLNKQVLEAKRRQVELVVDNKKLDAAQKLIEGINVVADKALSEETIKKIIEKDDLTPLDLKLMAEAMEKMTNTLKGLMNPSVQDEFGGRKKTKIMAAFKAPGGEQMMIAAELPSND